VTTAHAANTQTSARNATNALTVMTAHVASTQTSARIAPSAFCVVTATVVINLFAMVRFAKTAVSVHNAVIVSAVPKMIAVVIYAIHVMSV